MKRLIDILLAILLAICLFIPLGVIAIIIAITSRGPVIYWSDRVGRENLIFRMPKFRTMRLETPEYATHLLEKPEQWVTPIGAILRRSSLDELPQLWSILKGDMSFVGPRPALFNQDDLIALRTEKGIHKLIPGLTGLAQINGRDDIIIEVKVELDERYMREQSLLLDLKILIATLNRVIFRIGVSH